MCIWFTPMRLLLNAKCSAIGQLERQNENLSKSHDSLKSVSLDEGACSQNRSSSHQEN